MSAFHRTFEKLRGMSVPGVKKIVVAIVGGTVLLVGICMIFLPGPSFLVIPAGLAILATEFVWAQRWLHKSKALASKAKGVFKSRKTATPVQERVSVSSPPSTK